MSPTWPMQDWLSPLATLMLTLYFYLITFEIITEIALNAILSKGTIFYHLSLKISQMKSGSGWGIIWCLLFLSPNKFYASSESSHIYKGRKGHSQQKL